jgi:hypothetical protein
MIKSWHFVAIEENTHSCVVLNPLNPEKRKRSSCKWLLKPTNNERVSVNYCKEFLFCKSNGIKEIICHARNNAVSFYLNL